MQFNSIYQLLSMTTDRSAVLDAASDMLFMPDLFHYFFTGVKSTEFTIASTSGLLNPVKRDWDDELIAAIGIKKSLLPKLHPSGTVIGEIDADIRRETGAGAVKVVATAGHDTGSAVAAAPAEGRDWAFISSGTWSLMGIETDTPVLTEQASKLNLSNEGGICGRTRALKNIMGLWLLQQSRKAWAREKTYGYDELTRMAADAPAFRSLVDPDNSAFMNPPDMPAAIQQFCRETGQPVPESPAEVSRCIMESLAFKYRMVLDQLRMVNPDGPINRIHILGGGTQNELLCQFAADACNVPIITGPIEATAIGNMLVQAMALGYIKSPEEIREVVRRSFPMKTFMPENTDLWNAAYERFEGLVNL
jgi:rhamnulokinase